MVGEVGREAKSWPSLTSLLDQIGQITSRAVLEDKVEIGFVLGRAEQLDDEGVVHLVEQVALAEDMPRLAQVGDLLLIDFLDCHGLVCVFICCEDDAPVGALAKHLAHVVIVEICLSWRAGVHAAARAIIHARASCFNHVFAVSSVV